MSLLPPLPPLPPPTPSPPLPPSPPLARSAPTLLCAAVEEGEPGVLAAVKEGEWVGRAVLLVAVEEGEAGVLVVEGEEGKHVLVAVEDLVSSKPK